MPLRHRPLLLPLPLREGEGELSLLARSSAPTPGQSSQKGMRAAYFAEIGVFLECPVYDRYRLPVGQRFSGPAIVEERESTAVLGPRARVEVDRSLNRLVTMAG
jgi:N-methylhydantoinase A/oxoprolinase/acetone carboxylase beta subunit